MEQKSYGGLPATVLSLSDLGLPHALGFFSFRICEGRLRIWVSMTGAGPLPSDLYSVLST